MNRAGVRAAVTAEVVDAGRGGPDTQRVRASMVAAFERWCAANDEKPWPLTEDRLLVYLHAHYPNWSTKTARQTVSQLVEHGKTLGHPDPRTETVPAYLSALARDLGEHKAARTQALPAEALTAVSGAAQGQAAGAPAAEQLARRRALLVVCEALGVNPLTRRDVAAARALTRDQFTVIGQDVRARGTDWSLLVDRDRTPERYELLTTVLEGADPAATPLAGGRDIDADVDRVRDAVGRELLSAGQGTVTRAAAAAAWDAATNEERLKVIVGLDGRYRQRIQDAAYLLHGVATGHRHAELARLTLGHLRPTGTGWTYTLAEHKSAIKAASRGGKATPIVAGIDHLDEHRDRCPAWCPACALDRHVNQRLLDGATSTDRLYVSGTGKPLGRHVGAAIVARATGVENASTRSMRVTAATLAREAGMSYEEIRTQVTHHESVTTTQLYVRRADPFTADVTLVIAHPEPASSD